MFYSVCANALFSGTPLPDALPRIREAGFDHYEFWSWWDQDLDALERAQREQRLSPAALCTKFIPLTDPGEREAFLAGLGETIAAARRLGCETIIAQVGPDLPGVARAAQHASIVQGLRACAPMLDAAGMRLVVEPLNIQIDHIGYYLSDATEAFQIIDEVNCANVRVLYDFYHQYITNRCPIHEFTDNVEKIGHVHIAGFPGRHEPMSACEIDYPALLAAVQSSGYALAIGLEYFPQGDPLESLIQTRARLLH